MSADHDSSSTDRNRLQPPEPRLDGKLRLACGVSRGDGVTHRSASESVRIATTDCGGPPIENPSPVHRAVAARDRLWGTYGGEATDGCFVWTTPTGDPECGRD